VIAFTRFGSRVWFWLPHIWFAGLPLPFVYPRTAVALGCLTVLPLVGAATCPLLLPAWLITSILLFYGAWVTLRLRAVIAVVSIYPTHTPQVPHYAFGLSHCPSTFTLPLALRCGL